MTDDRRALVLVDGENVRRSRWPNLTQTDLLERARKWAAHEEVDLLLVFDRVAPETAEDVRAAPHADDEIAAIAAAADRPVWLVTSDRGLRARVPAARTIGGGSFLERLG
jgi:hypothetical protein